MMKIGFIGAGNMATAIVSGVIARNFLSPQDIAIYDISPEQTRKMSDAYAVKVMDSQEALLASCEYIVLAVKPIYLHDVLKKASSHAAGKKFISIAAGFSVNRLSGALDVDSAQVLRCIPNTPLMVGEGFTAICKDTTFSSDDLAWVEALFKTLGSVAVLPESMFDAIIGIAGSAPAYVFIFAEALIDAGIRLGLPRDVATRASQQTILGAAKLMLETGEHPAALKDMVCSPGGTTIEAVSSLERDGFRNAVIEAATAAAKKSQAMSQGSE